MAKMIFVNLPVADLAIATRFYEAVGCKKNPQFSDENAASMVWSDTITFQLLTRKYFGTFTAKPISDAHHTCAVLLALSQETRDGVDVVVEAAAAAGGKADVRERMDMGWLYNRAVEDPDGHILELIWMDECDGSHARRARLTISRQWLSTRTRRGDRGSKRFDHRQLRHSVSFTAVHSSFNRSRGDSLETVPPHAVPCRSSSSPGR